MNQKNVSKEELSELVSNFPTILRRALVAITVNTIESEDGELLSAPSLDENQYVIAVGDLVKDIKVGDKVILNLSALTKVRRVMGDSDQTISEIDLKTQLVNDTVVGIIDERVIEQIYK